MRGTPMLWEVIEEAFATAAAIVILMTPDEYVALHPAYASNEAEQLGSWQARSNVLFEAGAAMIRDRDRTFLMKLGKTQWGSDFSGMRYEAIGNDAGSRSNFRSALTKVADVNMELNTYLEPLRAGDFEACLTSHDSVTPHSPFKPSVALKSADQVKVDDELRTLAKALTQLEQEWRTEVGAPEYKLLFKYLKLFGVMHRITGHPDAGYSITLDGPSSLFKSTTLYGIRFAAFLPALLHATKWSLEARLHTRVNGEPTEASFTLDSSTTLTSHYPPGRQFDSILESGFAAAFAKLDTPWRLEREVELVDLGGTVMIADFRLVHPDGRAVLLEIVGYWRPEYLKQKFEKIAHSNRTDLVIAVSERLNLESSAKTIERLEDQIVWFKGALPPKRVLEVAERLEGHPQSI